MLLRLISVLCLFLAASPAISHPGGGHAQFSLAELAQHYAEPYHLAFLGLAFVIGLAAFGYGRRIEARSLVSKARKPVAKPDGERR